MLFSDRRQIDPIGGQDYLWHSDFSRDEHFCLSHMVGISSRQIFHFYQSLTHAQSELPTHRLEKALVRPRSGFMGRIVFRIFGLSDLVCFPGYFGLVSSDIVLDTRAVFPNSGLIFQDLHYGPAMAFVCRICGAGFWCFWGFSHFAGPLPDLGLMSSLVFPDARAGSPNAGVRVQDLHDLPKLSILVEFVGWNFGACGGFSGFAFLCYLDWFSSVEYALYWFHAVRVLYRSGF